MRLRSGIRCDVLVVMACVALMLLVLAPTATATAAAPAAAPAHLMVRDNGFNVLIVSWDPSGDATLKSEVTVGVQGSADPPDAQMVDPVFSETLVGVVCGETYVVTVKFVDLDGERGPAATTTASSQECTPGPPHTPAALHVVASTASGLNLAWDGSADNDVEEVDAIVHEPGIPDRYQRAPLEWAPHEILIAGLTCGTTYTIDLGVVDYDGQASPVSSVTGLTSDCALIGPMPGAPANFHVSGPVGKTVDLAWDPTPDPEVTSTTVELRGPGDVRFTQRADGMTTHMSVPVACAWEYQASVTWRYADGRRSEPASITLPVVPCPTVAAHRPAPPVTRGPIPWHRAGITLRRQARVTVTRTGTFVLPHDTVQCPAAGGTCRVVVRVETRIPGKRGLGPPVFLGETETTLTPQLVQTVTGRMSARGRALLRRRGRLPVAITIEAWHVAGLYAVTKHTTFVPARR